MHGKLFKNPGKVNGRNNNGIGEISVWTRKDR